MSHEDAVASVARYPLLAALRERRSRRFGRGMAMEAGPLAYRSRLEPLPLCEEEEALLAYAACGITGPALADLVFERGHGGTILAGLVGRTVASGDAIHTVSLVVTNRDATWLLKRPRDFAPADLPDLVERGRNGAFTDLYRRSRIKVRDGRTAPPLEPAYNLPVNRWSLYDPAATYFLPINDLTLLYVNGVLEVLDQPICCFLVDERAGFRPAGLGRFGRSRGGHLEDDPRRGRVFTIQQLESLVTEFVTIEQGMMLQNVALMTQAMGLGGFPHWAAHPFGWLRALGFRMREIRSDRYLGMGRLPSLLARLLGKTVPVPHAVGLEVDGEPMLAPFCPPYFPSMEAAVRAVVDLKFGEAGVFRAGVRSAGWKDPERIARAAPPPSAAAIDATIAYCDYVHGRYGRFPAYAPPFRTVLGFQACHLDEEFYDTFYRRGALSETQRRHMQVWHGAGE
jgi:hypothetical protein